MCGRRRGARCRSRAGPHRGLLRGVVIVARSDPQSSALNVAVWGAGERVVCVAGSLSWGEFAFHAQRPLARSHTLLLPDRRGYGTSPSNDRADFDVDAEDVAALLGESAHLVGHSYGAVVVLWPLRSDRVLYAR